MQFGYRHVSDTRGPKVRISLPKIFKWGRVVIPVSLVPFKNFILSASSFDFVSNVIGGARSVIIRVSNMMEPWFSRVRTYWRP